MSLNSFYYSLIKHKKETIGLFLALVCVSLFFAKDLKIILDTDKLLPPNHEYTIGSRKISEEFGLKYTIVVGISRHDSSQIMAADVAYVKDAAKKLALTAGVLPSTITHLTSSKIKGFRSSENEISIEPLYRNHTDLEAVFSKTDSDPLFKGLLLSSDKKTLFVTLDAESPNDGFRSLMGRVSASFGEPNDYEIRMTGFVPMMAAIEHYSDRVALLLLISFAIISILLRFLLNSFQAAVVPLLTGGCAIIVSLGLMGYFGIPIDVFNAVTPILIMAVISGHSTQIMCAFVEEIKRLRTDNIAIIKEHTALVNTMTQLFPTLVAAGLAASFGFLSLVIFEIQSIKTFGLLVGASIGIGVILELFFVPALRACFAEPDTTKDSSLTHALRQSSVKLGAIGLKSSGSVIFILFSSLCLFAYLATFVKVENSNKSNISSTEEIQQDDIYLNTYFPGTNTLYVMFDTGHPDGIKQIEFLKLIDDLARILETDASVGRTITYADHAKRVHNAFNPLSGYVLPTNNEELRDQLNFYELGSSPSDLSQFVNGDYSKTLLVVLLKDDSSATVDRLRKLVDGGLLKSGRNDQLKIAFGGSVAEAAAITDQLVVDKILNILQVLSVVLLVALVVFKSFPLAFLVVLPSIASVLFNFALMAVFNIPLNIPTSLCSAMVVGLGADYSIYFLMKVKQLKMQGLYSNREVLEKAIDSAGFVCFTVSVLIVSGYSTMLLSYQFLPHQWIALLVMSSMIVSALVTILALPAFLERSKSKFR